MNIKELIKELKKHQNQEVEVYIWFNDDIYPIDLVDYGIDDRLDLNIVGVKWKQD